MPNVTSTEEGPSSKAGSSKVLVSWQYVTLHSAEVVKHISKAEALPCIYLVLSSLYFTSLPSCRKSLGIFISASTGGENPAGMSFGYGVGDIIAISTLAPTIWGRFRDASGQFNAIQTE